MSINETNSGQIINGTFTDTSNGAVIPTNQTVSEMNQAGKITGCHVKIMIEQKFLLCGDLKHYHHIIHTF